MSKFKIKNLPPIRLVDLLKKKKTNLKSFISNSGIAAYQTLLQKCNKMGVSPPPEEEFKTALGDVVSSPQEGMIVLDPPKLVKENTGEAILVDDMGNIHTMSLSNDSENKKKSFKKKKKKTQR